MGATTLCALLGGAIAVLASASCSNGAWSVDYSPRRCHMVGDAAVVSCDARLGVECGMRMSSNFKVGLGIHSMTIKAAPGAGVATTFYLSTNGGLYDKMKRTPWVEIDWEILGLQAGPRTQIWTNLFTGVAQEHNQMITVPFDVSDDYHTYSFHISKSRVSWVVDGVTYRTVDIRSFPDVISHANRNRFQVFWTATGTHSPSRRVSGAWLPGG